MEERLLDIEIPSERYNNPTKEECNASYNLGDDSTIIIKGADKVSVLVVWDREDYLKEAYKQFEDSEVHEEVPNDLVNIMIKVLEKIRLRSDLSSDSLNYFFLLIFWIQNSLGFTFYLKLISVYTQCTW